MEPVHINLGLLDAAGIVTPHSGRSPAAEDFRVLKRSLLRKGGGPQRQRILVTSALPGEGKTFCALSLAMSIAAEADYTVLLVDANTVRPAVQPLLGLEPAAGLMDVLLDGEHLLPGVLQRTSIPRLTVLPVGCSHPRAAELLASQAMHRLLDDIGGRYQDRIVIFDSPPLLGTSEANELAAHAGQVLLVVEAHRTPQHAVAEALRRLSPHDGVSIVCNKAASGRGATH